MGPCKDSGGLPRDEDLTEDVRELTELFGTCLIPVDTLFLGMVRLAADSVCLAPVTPGLGSDAIDRRFGTLGSALVDFDASTASSSFANETWDGRLRKSGNFEGLGIPDALFMLPVENSVSIYAALSVFRLQVSPCTIHVTAYTSSLQQCTGI